jgi:hypothetical protein
MRGKNKKKEFSVMMNVSFFFLNVRVFFFFNSNEDSGAKFWVHFKMKPKF